jgi:hypothetical protein
VEVNVCACERGRLCRCLCVQQCTYQVGGCETGGHEEPTSRERRLGREIGEFPHSVLAARLTSSSLHRPKEHTESRDEQHTRTRAAHSHHGRQFQSVPMILIRAQRTLPSHHPREEWPHLDPTTSSGTLQREAMSHRKGDSAQHDGTRERVFANTYTHTHTHTYTHTHSLSLTGTHADTQTSTRICICTITTTHIHRR